jgi:putative transposase
MRFYENSYYHIYNRTINEELLFRSEENYLFFLKKYRYYLDEYLETIGYCLMPTHFHFLVRVKEIENQTSGLSDVSTKISRGMHKLQMSYTKAFNRRYNRQGSLFQAHYKAKQISNEPYLITLLTYIHQNPIRSGLVEKAEEWLFSSYQDYIDLRKGTLPSKSIILKMIKKQELKELTEKKLIEL